MPCAEDEIELVTVLAENPEAVSMFLRLGREYLASLPPEEADRFMQSMLERQVERDRWLLLLKFYDRHLGFVHMKVDKHERTGWGFILEFYIIADERRKRWGTRLYRKCEGILRKRGVRDIWLLTNPEAKPFWQSLGYMETGEMDKETGQEIMEKHLETSESQSGF